MGSRDAATGTGKTHPRVELIPWDPTDERQFQRLYDQRVACTWDYDAVAEWKGKMLGGQKIMYWIVSPGSLFSSHGWLQANREVQVLAEDAPGRDKLLEDHVKQFPTVRSSSIA